MSYGTRLGWIAALMLVAVRAYAGPPYVTDDPEPVDYQHWELYLATQHEVTRDSAAGTAPHVEINYGAAPNLQLHVIVPLAYARAAGTTTYGRGDIELGAKLRFVQENEAIPMLGTFPLVEIPVGNAGKGLGSGHVRSLIPLWVQKSRGPWTTYGGGGYWINPGTGNRNFWYVGWLAQVKLAERAAVGAEVFYTTPDRVDGRRNLRFNIGTVMDATEHQHVLASIGRSITGDSLFLAYFAYQLTL